MSPFLVHALTFKLHQQQAIAELFELLPKKHLHERLPKHDVPARFAQWHLKHQQTLTAWPGSALLSLLREMFSPEPPPVAEQSRILQLVENLAVGQLDEIATMSVLLEISLDTYAMRDFRNSRVLLAGDFVRGNRQTCETITRSAGGEVVDEMNADVNYLVLGGLGLPNWYRGERGIEYELAAMYRRVGLRLRVVHEAHWLDALHGQQRTPMLQPERH